MKDVWILVEGVVGGDIVLEEVVEGKREIVFRNLRGEGIGGRVCRIDNEEKII